MGPGNFLAYTVLLLWPVLTFYWFSTKQTQLAILMTILGGFLILPVRTEINIPMFPGLGKHSLPVMACILALYLISRKRLQLFNHKGWMKILVIIMIFIPMINALANTDSVVISQRLLPGLSLYDGITGIVHQTLFFIPFLIGRQFFKTFDDQVLMFKTLVIGGLIYSALMLFEVRMSPQLHTWLYGYFPDDFAQQRRFGGFRPVVFVGHGLLVAFFAATVLVAVSSLSKVNRTLVSLPLAKLKYYFLVVLLLCKSLAALVYGFFAFIVISFMSVKNQYRFAIVLAFIAFMYPFMSMMKIFPHQQVVNIAEQVDVDRSLSLAFRFENEEILLEHARKQLLFGWGGYGRNRVFDKETGSDVSVTDGRWIITFGKFGLIGFLAEFGILALTIFKAYQASKRTRDKSENLLLAGHAIIVSLIMIDQLPNASLAPWLWLLAGILYGRSEYILSEAKRNTVEQKNIHAT